MTLVRAFSKVDKEGKVAIPSNIRTQAKLKPGQLVEFKLTGAGKAKNLIISQRENFR
jgi:bifunctional DNA-binding transcriptional regulator/antitoxin component of YhaV-PrlF toxin-antitoxin module